MDTLLDWKYLRKEHACMGAATPTSPPLLLGYNDTNSTPPPEQGLLRWPFFLFSSKSILGDLWALLIPQTAPKGRSVPLYVRYLPNVSSTA